MKQTLNATIAAVKSAPTKRERERMSTDDTNRIYMFVKHKPK